MDDYRKIQFDALNKMVGEVFVRSGYSAEDARIIADVLLAADLSGIESHGVQRLVLYQYGISIGRIKVDAKPTVVKETPLSVVIDADQGMGQVVSHNAMKAAIEKAKKSGIGVALVRNSNHYGIAGYYSMMAAKEGLLGISMTNTQALAVPTFGRTPLLGTNPIAVAMPADPAPFALDMSTSVVTGGKMEVYAKNHKPLPEGWAVDAQGFVNTDAQAFVNNRGASSGGLLPLGGAGELFSGHKGFGLSMVVELMTGIMSGGVTSAGVRKVKEQELCCHMFAAVDYAMFTDDKAALEKRFSDYMRLIRGSEPVEGQERIYLAGDKEREHMENARKNGIPVNGATYDELNVILKKQGMDPAEYLIEVGV